MGLPRLAHQMKFTLCYRGRGSLCSHRTTSRHVQSHQGYFPGPWHSVPETNTLSKPLDLCLQITHRSVTVPRDTHHYPSHFRLTIPISAGCLGKALEKLPTSHAEMSRACGKLKNHVCCRSKYAQIVPRKNYHQPRWLNRDVVRYMNPCSCSGGPYSGPGPRIPP